MNPACPVKLNLQHVACDLCGGTDTAQVTRSSDHEHGVAGQFNVVRCTRCGLHYLNPRPAPDSIGACYPHDYYAYAAAGSERASPRFKQRIKRLIRSSPALSTVARQIAPLRHLAADSAIAADIADWIKPGKVLDVGCGSGAFLDGMLENGWATFGIEPSAPAAAVSRAKGHAVLCQSATDALDEKLAAQLFDIILMSHSLEHVHSPTEALAHLRPILQPGTGHLIIEVPNVESLLTYWFGELGLAFDTPRHLYLFSPDTLRAQLEKAGFEVCSVRHVSRPMQFVRCLRLLSEASTPASWRSAASATLEDPAALQALKSLATLASTKNMGGSIRAVAIRQ